MWPVSGLPAVRERLVPPASVLPTACASCLLACATAPFSRALQLPHTRVRPRTHVYNHSQLTLTTQSRTGAMQTGSTPFTFSVMLPHAPAARKALRLSSPFAPPTETTRSTSAPLAAPGSRAGCAAGSRPACAARIGSSAPSSCATCREWRRRTRRGQAPVPKGRARRRRRTRKRRRRTRPRPQRRRRRRPRPRPRLRWRTFGVCKDELQALSTCLRQYYFENPD